MAQLARSKDAVILTLFFGPEIVHVLLNNVAHVPDLRYHFFFLPALVKDGHTIEGRPTEVV